MSYPPLSPAKEKPAKALEMSKESPPVVVKAIAAPGEISTPEKPAHLPWRSRVAFSVKDVKEVALGLQKPHKDFLDLRKSDLKGSGEADSDDDLLQAEQQLRSASSSSNLTNKSPSKSRSPRRLPDKYEILVEFFNSMECSIRLLKLKRSLPTFASICSSIQHLTGRRFTYGHLAQLMYILPKSISIKKVLLRDEATCCMKPELQIYLQTEPIVNCLKHKEESGYSILRKAFRQKIVVFYREHPEVDDIPEVALPHPFCHQRKLDTPSEISGDSSYSSPIISTSDTDQLAMVASHIPQSFQRRFSQKTLITNTEKTSLLCFANDSHEDDPPVPIGASPTKCSSRTAILKKPMFASAVPKSSLATHSGSKEDMSGSKEDISLVKVGKSSPQKLNNLGGTPVKLVSTPIRLMTATPEIQTPKRLRPTTMHDTPLKEPEKCKTKLLFATPQKGAKADDSGDVILSISDDDDVVNILPETLLQEIREKEQKAVEERGTCTAEAKRRKEMLASLPKLFDMILLIFQSCHQSLITRQELVHKILAGCLSIVDRSEVEQQLELLQELAPDWISAKMVSGNYFYSVNKMSSLQEIRQRLAEAK